MIKAKDFIKAGKVYKKVLLFGDERFFIEKIKDIYKSKIENIDVIIFDPAKDNWEEIIVPLFTGFIFQKRCVLIIENLVSIKINEFNKWLEKIKKIPSNIYVVGIYETEKKQDDDRIKELKKFFKQGGEIIDCFVGSDVKKILLSTFKKEGIEFSERDFETLVELGEGHLMDIKSEVDKMKIVKEELGRSLQMEEIIGGKTFISVKGLQSAFENKERTKFFRYLYLPIIDPNFKFNSLFSILFGTCIYNLKSKRSLWTKKELINFTKFLFKLEKAQREGRVKHIREHIMAFTYRIKGWRN